MSYYCPAAFAVVVDYAVVVAVASTAFVASTDADNAVVSVAITASTDVVLLLAILDMW